MRAMVITQRAEGPALELQQVPEPVPGPDDLLVAVRAIGLNRAELMLLTGHYERIATRPTAAIAGLEAAGEVIGMGAAVQGFKIGDRVMGMPPGAYAERTLLPHRLAMRVPDAMSWERAAAVPVALLTAHDALVTNGAMRAGDTVLVLGAATGVGIVAVQAARLLGPARVLGTSTSPSKHAPLAALGIDAVLEATGGHGADVVIDMVGASAAPGIMRCAAVGARWVQVGRVGGSSHRWTAPGRSRRRRRRTPGCARTCSSARWCSCPEDTARRGAARRRAAAPPTVRPRRRRPGSGSRRICRPSPRTRP